jgi:histidyl-tRNA synthetase
LGIDNVALEINSIGCPECRKKYLEALKAHFENKKADLCETCLSRLDRNPMRILDCKSPVCSKISEDAPVVLDFICDDCREHFESLKKYLDTMGIEYKVNPQIVRGLDYYTRTVFEFVSKYEKTNGLVVCGGGRYDGLIEELGGASIPACGFGMGLERLVLIMESAEIPFPEAPKYNLSIVTAGDAALLKALQIATDMRSEGYSVSVDTVGRSIKAQMKYSNKIGAEYTVVLGDNELAENKAKLKNMSDGTETEVSLDKFSEDFFQSVVKDSMDGIADASFFGI